MVMIAADADGLVPVRTVTSPAASVPVRTIVGDVPAPEPAVVPGVELPPIRCFTVILPAAKFPELSRLTIAFAVLTFVGMLAKAASPMAPAGKAIEAPTVKLFTVPLET